MALDREFIKESKLEGVYKRMKQINEYVITNGRTTEADNMQGQADPSQDQVAGAQDGGMQQPMDGDMAQDNAMPMDQNMGGAQGEMGMNQDSNGMADAPAEPDPTIGAEVPDAASDGEQIDDIEMEASDDEVIDVDDLTNSQESAEYKIDGVDDKLTKLLAIAGKFAKAIEDNDAKLEDLKSEMEKRNPTDVERINIRSQNSQPFNVNPGEYWETARAKNPNYDVISDNNVAPNEEEKTYTITDNDLKDFNSAEVEKSFSDMPKDFMDYFK